MNKFQRVYALWGEALTLVSKLKKRGASSELGERATNRVIRRGNALRRALNKKGMSDARIVQKIAQAAYMADFPPAHTGWIIRTVVDEEALNQGLTELLEEDGSQSIFTQQED